MMLRNSICLAQVFWPKVVLKKWLNLRSKGLEFAADEDDAGSDIDDEGSARNPLFSLRPKYPFSVLNSIRP
jgi:hypothetical protein